MICNMVLEWVEGIELERHRERHRESKKETGAGSERKRDR